MEFRVGFLKGEIDGLNSFKSAVVNEKSPRRNEGDYLKPHFNGKS